MTSVCENGYNAYIVFNANKPVLQSPVSIFISLTENTQASPMEISITHFFKFVLYYRTPYPSPPPSSLDIPILSMSGVWIFSGTAQCLKI